MIFLGDLTPDDRLVIFRGAPTLRDVFAPDGQDALLQEASRRCDQEGHAEHTCPACGDRSCLRCGLGLP